MAQVLQLTCLISAWFLFLTKFCYFTEAQSEKSPDENVIDTSDGPLFLTPFIREGKIKEAQDAAEVTEIPELEGLKSYSGYLTVNKRHHSNMFFWFFLSQNDYKNAPVVLWLQGGPGRSSLRGLLMENGPFDIGTGALKKRNATWIQDHSVIYLDSPIGAGFSHAEDGYHHSTLAKVGEDLYNAILQFFQLFPDLQKNDFYIAGQSYGGKWVPTIAHLIHKRNPQAEQKINLVGIAIGNGLVDPTIQLQYSELLYQIGLINLKGKKQLEGYEHRLVSAANNKSWDEAYTIYSEIVLNTKQSEYRSLTGFGNVVNFLQPKPSFDKEIQMSLYVSKPAIRKAIHAGDKAFFPYSGFIQYFLREDMMQSVAPLLSELIDNYKVMIYNGQLDIIIPYRTTVNYLRKLTFNGVEKYDEADRHKWHVGGELAGYVTKVGNLTEVMVRNAGHSVPEDQIVWATDMLYRFTRNLTFKKHKNSTVELNKTSDATKISTVQ